MPFSISQNCEYFHSARTSGLRGGTHMDWTLPRVCKAKEEMPPFKQEDRIFLQIK